MYGCNYVWTKDQVEKATFSKKTRARERVIKLICYSAESITAKLQENLQGHLCHQHDSCLT